MAVVLILWTYPITISGMSKFTNSAQNTSQGILVSLETTYLAEQKDDAPQIQEWVDTFNSLGARHIIQLTSGRPCGVLSGGIGCPGARAPR